MSTQQLDEDILALEAEYAGHQAAGLALDLTRGKPSIPQLALSNALDGALEGDFEASDGTDVRGYGGLEGLPEARALGAQLMGVGPEQVLVGGNSSLTLMYLFMMHCHHHGPGGDAPPWRETEGGPRFLCPVPGYDRHFGICEDLGIQMLPVPMTGEGPDMNLVESLVVSDPRIRGLWCVPRYSNPSGETYSEDTVARIAALGRRAAPGFRVMWDNAYSAHHLGAPEPLASITAHCDAAGTAESIAYFASTSKITFAGAGLAFFAGYGATLSAFKKRLEVLTIGPDKVNQLRHARFLGRIGGIDALMAQHREILEPKFRCVSERLQEGLGNTGMGRWTDPAGGYFVSFDTGPGLAREVIALAAGAGVKLTPAGSAFPYGDDPEDTNIRLAPSFPPLEDVDRAMAVFVTCVKLATLRQRRAAEG